MVKNPPSIQETWVWSLGWEDPLEEGMATHSSIFAWRIPWTEEPGGLQSMGLQRVGHSWSDLAHTHAADGHLGCFYFLVGSIVLHFFFFSRLQTFSWFPEKFWPYPELHSTAFFCFCFLLSCMLGRILVPWPGTEPRPQQWKPRSPNHDATRECPQFPLL